MQIVIVSDLHGQLPGSLPSCDLLLIAGDIGLHSVTNSLTGYARQHSWWEEFAAWLGAQPAKHIVGIAGNVDFLAEEEPALMRQLPWTYLDDRTVMIGGLLIHGSPYAMKYGRWAFMETDEELARRWELIPRDTDILMVHGPAYGILDHAGRGEHTGSRTLRKRLEALRTPLVVSGHIHEDHGIAQLNGRLHINAALAGGAQPAIVDWLEDYGPVLRQHPDRGRRPW